jgi:hypothetical protein
MTRLVTRLVAGCTIVAVGACGGSSTPTEPTTTTPPTLVTETFSGLVKIGGQSYHPFTVSASNYDVAVTLTTAGPPSTILMLLSFGTVADNLCVPLNNASTLAQAGSFSQLSGTINAGNYCVSVADAGNQVQDVSYALILQHY